MGAKSRTKGARNERALVALMIAAGFKAEKISRSGYTGPDIRLALNGRVISVESKVRANGFKEIYAWLEHADMLIIKSDRQTPLFVVPLPLGLDIGKAATICTADVPTGPPCHDDHAVLPPSS